MEFPALPVVPGFLPQSKRIHYRLTGDSKAERFDPCHIMEKVVRLFPLHVYKFGLKCKLMWYDWKLDVKNHNLCSMLLR